MFASSKEGVSASELQRALSIGSYATAWAMLHRLRCVLIRPGREPLTGPVEVDETYIGGKEPGLAGGRAKAKKALVAIAIEVHEPRGFGRVRMRVIDDASAITLNRFIADNVDPGATVATDGWTGYAGVGAHGFTHQRRNQSAAKARGEDPGAATARRAPRRILGQTLARRHPPRSRRDRSSPGVSRLSMSSASASTGAIPPPAACCSTGCSNSPSVIPPCVTTNSSPTRRPNLCRHDLPAEVATRPPTMAQRSHQRRSGQLKSPMTSKQRCL